MFHRVLAGLHLDPYDGDEDETEALYFSQAKRGYINHKIRNYRITQEMKTQEILQVIKQNPTQILKYIPQFLHAVPGAGIRRYRKHKFCHQYGPGMDIIEKDWDNLIILDSCRYDVFKEESSLEGKLNRAISVASKTSEFVRRTFAGRKLHDTVYITSNPHAEDLKELNNESPVFHSLIESYNIEAGGRNDIPHKMGQQGMKQLRNLAIEAHANYPNKRLIVHFMPPHFPAFGEMADTLRNELRDEYQVEFTQIRRMREKQLGNKKQIRNLRRAAERGYIPFERAKDAYRENLRLVLDSVDSLISKLSGKTVVSADHGELFGERTVFTPLPKTGGHPERVYTPELRVVPWLITDFNQRRSITYEEPIQPASVSDDIICDRLRALGYR